MAETFELEAEYLHAELGSAAWIRVDGHPIKVDIVAVRPDPDRGRIVLTAGFPLMGCTVDLHLEPSEVVEVELRASYRA
jgi:hypothetical protein